MFRLKLLVMTVTALACLMVSPADARITRVAAQYNLVNFYGGYATPHGEYDEVGLIRFVDELDRPVELDADSLFEETFFLGLDYGTLYRKHFLFLIGFRYTQHSVKEWLERSYGEEIGFHQYDIELNANYMFVDLANTPISPNIGAGVQAGFTSFAPKGFDNESEINLALSVNAGLDLKVYEGPRSFVTLASMNDFNLLASDDRPKYLNLGLALRYYFR